MRLLSYSLCVFFGLTVITCLVYFYLILSNLLAKPNARINSLNLISGLHPNAKFNEQRAVDYSKFTNDSINSFRNKLIAKLRRYESIVSKLFQLNSDYNLYKVQFKGKKNSLVAKRDFLCDIDVKVITKSNTNLISNDLNFDDISRSLTKDKSELKCAIVSNSGSLSGSNLGEEIDSHDIVMRFNNAPTVGFEDDVGIKTSIRLLNSQLLLNDNFNISSSYLYRTELKIVWDASDYNLNYKNWFYKSNHFFNNYEKVVQKFPNETFAVLDPKLIWKAWDLLQSTTSLSIPKNPPTSGFIGIIILMKICSDVDIYEYIPSMRISDKCHYYDNHIDIGCTFGHWYVSKVFY